MLAAGAKLPEFRRLREWMDSGAALGNPTLEAEVRKTGDAELTDLLAWSNKVNRVIEETVKMVPPFPWCAKSLPRIVSQSDVIVVSQTPTEALVREWEENGILDVPQVIAGQELGSKSEHLKLAAQGHYAPESILMIGDAPGDLKAAQSVNAPFFPINPGHEDASWKRFYEDGYVRFLNGDFLGTYQEELIAEFQSLLPDVPPWKR